MNRVTLHILHSEPSDDFGELRLARIHEQPGSRVALWDGLPPPAIPDAPDIAPTAIQGDIDNHRAYAEALPEGLRLAQVDLPARLAPCVGAGVIHAVLTLRGASQHHGVLVPQRVMLGIDGRVVLFGRGRREGSREHDTQQALAILRSLSIAPASTELHEVYDELRAEVSSEDREALAAFIARAMPPSPAVTSHVTLQIGPAHDSLDEVLHDLGTDPSEGHGLLDPYTPYRATPDAEHTAELTSGSIDTTGGQPLALSLWTRLAAPPQHAAPQDRFDEIDGSPSQCLKALLHDEATDTLPTLIGGEVNPFLLRASDATEDTPLRGQTLDAFEYTPAHRDEDGDTAVYDTRVSRRHGEVDRIESLDRIKALEDRLAAAEARALPSPPVPVSDATYPTVHTQRPRSTFARAETYLVALGAAVIAAALVYLVMS